VRELQGSENLWPRGTLITKNAVDSSLGALDNPKDCYYSNLFSQGT